MIFAAALAVVLAAAPPAAGAREPVRDCLMLADSASTHYHPVDDHTIIVESGPRWYRLITTPSSMMLRPDSFFINEIRGPSTLCSALDFQLSVAESPGLFREPLIVQSFTQIAPEEGRALRRRFIR